VLRETLTLGETLRGSTLHHFSTWVLDTRELSFCWPLLASYEPMEKSPVGKADTPHLGTKTFIPVYTTAHLWCCISINNMEQSPSQGATSGSVGHKTLEQHDHYNVQKGRAGYCLKPNKYHNPRTKCLRPSLILHSHTCLGLPCIPLFQVRPTWLKLRVLLSPPLCEQHVPLANPSASIFDPNNIQSTAATKSKVSHCAISYKTLRSLTM
jgi:hypothetical protein